MKARILSISIFLLTTTLNIFSQNITVVDEYGESLIGANVAIKDGEKTISGTATNFEGQFNLSNIDSGELCISYLGFETICIDSSLLETEDTIILNSTNINLVEIQVVAYKPITLSECWACGGTVCSHNFSKTKVDKVEKTYSNKTWEYFPNPTSGPLTIKNDSHKNGQLEVFNLQGFQVASFQINDSQNSIDLSNLIAGSYFLRYIGANEAELIGRVVKVE